MSCGEWPHRLLAEKPEGKKPLERTRHRWADNIKMDLGEIGLGGRGFLTGLAWLRIGRSGELL
jgi:hypothetical protein